MRAVQNRGPKGYCINTQVGEVHSITEGYQLVRRLPKLRSLHIVQPNIRILSCTGQVEGCSATRMRVDSRFLTPLSLPTNSSNAWFSAFHIDQAGK
ncbi:hypothetical protein HBI56_053990 [Parastagonospora nodorum]|uniref:Uncharacterized protein n=1 Tax=Phaeosphaeria nodorum (strain SN15 / ATCC MYA-4574 / FGSC 10173) TaxID=321614 RepID=A0A7U2ICN4_PHANO|nr:hypothetical protein HBH56_098090 [Parastagonospora nodorum]QRD07345.1 hypothetical protein JI435_424270 [Parastagonospora nodorum SN15]KAH3930305.1 hypothetical protein HBH54_112410 [Parastagonospora nodorum]KAH3938980.1 hypothetical protein HBH53_242260 [Parastagonospora nodorum]KAH3964693.1 hypothetical protein HBH51_159610 [Parastagonospora nodorum]